jgi:hypothetical protein
MERKLPNINFQKMLSEHTATFSFSRPTDLLRINIENNKRYPVYSGSYDELTPQQYSKFIFDLLQHHDIKPPYVLIGFSEGGIDVYCFAYYYNKYVKQIFLLDPSSCFYLDHNLIIEYEALRKQDKLVCELFIYKPIKPDIEKNFNIIKALKYFNKSYNKLTKNQKNQYDTVDNIICYNFSIKMRAYLDNMPIYINDKQINICFAESDDCIDNSKYNVLQCSLYELIKEKNINTTMLRFSTPHEIYAVKPITLKNYIINNIV